MSNTKDTPIDYKQFEGHYIPNKEVPPEETSQALRNKFREKNKECESLKLELQKQKELNDELVNGLTRAKERIAYDNPNYEKYESTYCKSVILELESLIKKSSEI